MPLLPPQPKRQSSTIQYCVQPPTGFVAHHQQQILPDWRLPIGSVLVLLQRAPIALLDRTAETEVCKDQLRERCLGWGEGVGAVLRQSAHCSAMFDPRTGLPIDTRAGTLRLDDVAVVRSILGYATLQQGGCATILHPDWGSAVYPSVLLSSASPLAVEQVVRALGSRACWQPATPASPPYVKP